MFSQRRLLIVSHEMTLSGAPIQLTYLVQWLQHRGWKTVVVAPEPGPLAAKLEGIEIIYEPLLLIDPAYWALRRLAPRFDLVLANTIATWEAVQACQFEHVPVVWYIHETQVGAQLMQLIHMIEPSLGLADAVVTPTCATARVYAPFVRRSIDVVPYGIPAANPGTPLSSGKLRFLVVATYEPRKGQDLLVEAVRQLSSGTHARTLFQFAGRTLDEPFYVALRERSSDLDNVECLGPLEHEQALQMMRDAHVVVCPSRDETMPIVLLEAFSMSKAVVSFDVGGIREWIRDGLNGLLVPAEDVSALAAAIERVAGDPNLRRNLGVAAHETFERNFTIDRLGEQFEAVIDRTSGSYIAETT